VIVLDLILNQSFGDITMEREIRLGKAPFGNLIEDLKLCRNVVTPKNGSRTLAPAGYVFMSIKYGGGAYRCDFQKVIDGKTYFLYAKPSQLFLDTFARVAIDGLSAIEIITNPAWDREGGAIVIGSDKSMISREWVALLDKAELPDLETVEVYEV
jgi:hypothetical protein